ncbi:NAD(P)-dependent oxidoreductase [Pseudaestuariivita atlantica]|uniref:NAD(P)-dependent oxidoreductase n=1 Tax=Pseudaestuariivita atlantica TaxID=1317121 RepID=UPI00067C7368|nr:NAD(P)-dependent oxidoreductase [Pseudaestuariivita atlantica]
MKTFPMFLQMAGRRVVIAGGGEQGAQKVRLFSKTEARIDVLAPDLGPELAGKAAEGLIHHDDGPITPGTFRNAALVVIGTGCPGADAALHALAKESGAIVNVVDQPWLCDAITPSIVDRDPVIVAIGTEGTAPVLGRQIKTRIETLLEPSLGALAAGIGAIRDRVAFRFGPRDRRDFYRWVFAGSPRSAHASGDTDAAWQAIEAAIDTGTFGNDQAQVLVVEARPGATDLITLRAVAALQEVDVVFHAGGLEGYLELPRRDAERGLLSMDDLAGIEAAQADGARVVCLVPTGAGAGLAARLGCDWIAGP